MIMGNAMSYALIVIDYQVDFVAGSLGSEQAVGIEGNIVKKIEECIGRNGRLIFTKDTHYDDYLSTDEGEHIPVTHCVKGTPGWELFGRVRSFQDKGTVIEKTTFGTFDIIDPIKGCEEIELCGVATNICVIANAVIAKTAYPESRVMLDTRCVASYDEDLHNKAIEVMGSLTIDILDQDR